MCYQPSHSLYVLSYNIFQHLKQVTRSHYSFFDLLEYNYSSSKDDDYGDDNGGGDNGGSDGSDGDYKV